jgi:hypothetical protein
VTYKFDKATKICYYTTLVGIIIGVIIMNSKINKNLQDLVIKQKELKKKQIEDVGYYYLNRELTKDYHYDY